MYVDEFGDEWESEMTYLGAALALDCPAGKPVGQLLRLSGGNLITYRLPGWKRSRTWPPDATAVNYGERCPCEACDNRLVGEAIDKLALEVNEIHATTKSHMDTYELRYLEEQ